MSPEETQQHMTKYRAWLSALGDSALAIAKQYPYLDVGGSLEVSEMMQVSA